MPPPSWARPDGDVAPDVGARRRERDFTGRLSVPFWSSRPPDVHWKRIGGSPPGLVTRSLSGPRNAGCVWLFPWLPAVDEGEDTQLGPGEALWRHRVPATGHLRARRGPPVLTGPWRAHLRPHHLWRLRLPIILEKVRFCYPESPPRPRLPSRSQAPVLVPALSPKSGVAVFQLRT